MNSLRRFIEESSRRSNIIDSSGRQIKPIVEHLAKLIVCREGNSSYNDWPSQIDNFFNIISDTGLGKGAISPSTLYSYVNTQIQSLDFRKIKETIRSSSNYDNSILTVPEDIESTKTKMSKFICEILEDIGNGDNTFRIKLDDFLKNV